MHEQVQSDQFLQGQHLFNVTQDRTWTTCDIHSCLLGVVGILYVSCGAALTLLNEIRELSVLCDQDKALSYLIFAKDISLGNAEQQGIGNLPSSAGHQNSNRLRLQD